MAPELWPREDAAPGPQPRRVAVSVVIPCYRSHAVLPELVSELRLALAELAVYEVILVVDGSSDPTGDVAAELARNNPEVTALILRRNYGQHNALIAGIRAAPGDVIVTMDDDLQHPPDQIRMLLEALESSGSDLAYGVPVAEEHGLVRSAASRATKIALAASGVPNARSVSAFRAFRSPLRTAFDGVDDAFVNVDVVLSWATEAVVTVPIEMRYRPQGKSGYSAGRLFRHAFNMITGYSESPLRLVTYLGLACSLLGAILLVLVLAAFVSGTTSVAGFTSVASMIALFAGAQMLSIGILGEYLGRVHMRTTGKPMYLVAREVRSTKGRRPTTTR